MYVENYVIAGCKIKILPQFGKNEGQNMKLKSWSGASLDF